MNDFLFGLPASPTTGERWIDVALGGLQQQIQVKVALIDGRPAIVGLRIDNETEITSRSLRSIKVPDLAKRLVEHIRQTIQAIEPTAEQMEAAKRYDGPLSPDWSDEAAAYLEIWEAGAAADGLRMWLEELADVDTVESPPRGRGAKPPSERELRAFAKAYLEELTRGSYGAKTRTAARLHINRSTVYAWVRLCRDRGLIPEEKS